MSSDVVLNTSKCPKRLQLSRPPTANSRSGLEVANYQMIISAQHMSMIIESIDRAGATINWTSGGLS